MNDKEMEALEPLKFLYSLSLNCSIGDIQEKQVKVAFEAVHAALTELAEIKERAEEMLSRIARNNETWDYPSHEQSADAKAKQYIDYILKGENK